MLPLIELLLWVVAYLDAAALERFELRPLVRICVGGSREKENGEETFLFFREIYYEDDGVTSIIAVIRCLLKL